MFGSRRQSHPESPGKGNSQGSPDGLLPRRQSEPANSDTFDGPSSSSSPKRFFLFKKGFSKSPSENAIETAPQIPSGPREKPIIGEAICEVSVVASCKVKAAGYLRVQEGDLITVLSVIHPEPGVVYARDGDGEMGRVVRSAVRLDQHSSNLYLQVVRVLVQHVQGQHAQLLWDAMERKVVTPADVLDMLLATGLLYEGVKGLVQVEMTNKERRHLETEFMREASPAMEIAQQLLQWEQVAQWRLTMVRHVVARIACLVQWTPHALQDVIDGIFSFLQQQTLGLPPEIALLLKAIRDVSSLRMTGSFFCLRFLCPSLVQPREVGGLKESELGPDVSKVLMQVAKTLQLIANGVDPKEDSFAYPIRAALTYHQESMERVCSRIITAVDASQMTQVRHSLLKPASSLYGYVCLHDQLSDDQKASQMLKDLRRKLGPPVDLNVAQLPEAIVNAEKLLKVYG